MTAQQEWEEFSEMVGLNAPDMPAIQRQEMRRAFFAGQLAMFTFQMKEMCTVSDDKAMKLIAAREQEITQFFKANFSHRN